MCEASAHKSPYQRRPPPFTRAVQISGPKDMMRLDSSQPRSHTSIKALILCRRSVWEDLNLIEIRVPGANESQCADPSPR